MLKHNLIIYLHYCFGFLALNMYFVVRLTHSEELNSNILSYLKLKLYAKNESIISTDGK